MEISKLSRRLSSISGITGSVSSTTGSIVITSGSWISGCVRITGLDVELDMTGEIMGLSSISLSSVWINGDEVPALADELVTVGG